METLKQTLMVTEDHQAHFDVNLPREFPTGLTEVILIFSPKTRSNKLQASSILKFAGALKNSPSFSGDPLLIQKAIRDEWER